MGLCILRFSSALAHPAAPVAPHASGARASGLSLRPRLGHAVHDGASPRRRPRGGLEAVAWALWGHGARVGPPGAGLVSPGTRAWSLQARRHHGPAPHALPKALGADAPQSWVTGARVAIAPTAAHAGIFGAAVAPSASQ